VWYGIKISQIPYHTVPCTPLSTMATRMVFFTSSRELRQGDLFSPLLFVLIIEALSHLMVHATNGGYISSFLVGTAEGNSLMVSHLLFADDTLIFCNVDLIQIEYLRRVHMV
jgi:hypothetical protein